MVHHTCTHGKAILQDSTATSLMIPEGWLPSGHLQDTSIHNWLLNYTYMPCHDSGAMLCLHLVGSLPAHSSHLDVKDAC